MAELGYHRALPYLLSEAGRDTQTLAASKIAVPTLALTGTIIAL